MRVLRPNDLMREAAAVLESVRDNVTVIGAVAVQVALDGTGVSLMPTRDVDAGVATADVPRVVDSLEAAGLKRSDLPHERGFTWVRGELKIQLLRPFDPFPKGPARSLPVSNILPELVRHRVAVAFEDAAEACRFWAASAAALVGLKEAAFGRISQTGEPVDRDFSDVALLLQQCPHEIAAELRDASPMRGRAVRAAERLMDPRGAAAAGRELVRSGQYETQRAAELAVNRTARLFLERLARSLAEP